MKLNKEMFVLKIGSRIRDLRIEKGYTVEQLAHEAGIETRQLLRIELGQINTSIFQIYNLALALDVPMKGIFNF